MSKRFAQACLFTFMCSGMSFIPVQAQDQSEVKQPLPLEELRTFTEIFERIKAAYVEPVDDAELLENAVRGMLAGLDPHSNYLDPLEFRDLQVNTSGEFGGLGIEVGMEDGLIRIITPIDDTPAEQAGVKAGDLIIKLDSHSVQGMSLNDAVKLMRGKVGTDLKLTIIREGEAKPIEITVTRDIIRVASVKKRLLDEHFGYLRISQFQLETGKDLLKAMKDLQDSAELKGFVLDLRNNPGGVLQAAVDVSDAFLSGGDIVYTEGRIKQAELRYAATKNNPSKELPVIVLINGGSASASEIVAGALQDHQRAVIVGTASFGKGSVQTVLPLTNERALKLTTARYFTPKGRSIQAEGIIPDILIEPSRVTKVEGVEGFKEADLQGHLSNGNTKSGAAAERASENSMRTTEEAALLGKDYQLNEALNLLKGIAIYQHSQRAVTTGAAN